MLSCMSSYKQDGDELELRKILDFPKHLKSNPL